MNFRLEIEKVTLQQYDNHLASYYVNRLLRLNLVKSNPESRTDEQARREGGFCYAIIGKKCAVCEKRSKIWWNRVSNKYSRENFFYNKQEAVSQRYLHFKRKFSKKIMIYFFFPIPF